MSKVLCCFKLPLSGQVTTGKVGAAKVDRRAAARTGTGRQRSLRRASGRPRAVSLRRWGAQVPFHSQLPRVPPHTRSRPAGRACSQRPQHGGCTASRSTNGPSRPGPGEGKREPSPNSVFSQCHSPRRLCGSSWVTLRGPLEHPLCPFVAGVPFSCLPAIYPPDMDTQTSWPECVPLASRLTSPASPQRSWEPSLGLWIPTPRAQGPL